MAAFAGLLLCAHIVKAFATETTGSCTEGSQTGESIDGYELLKKGGPFRMVYRTFALTDEAYRCISSTTIEEDASIHKVTERVEFMTSISENSYSYNRSFIFECGTRGYDTMKSIEPDGISPLSYQFLSVDPQCIVLEDVSPQRYHYGNHPVEERNSNKQNTQQARRDCMLWVTGMASEPSESCTQLFGTLCGGSSARHHFNKAGCTLQGSDTNKMVAESKP
uniref:Putative lipocalin-6 1 n=1 Tax=Amblyomma americanum TaxID=6943 RepID=A0A0C9RY20_AMBAM